MLRIIRRIIGVNETYVRLERIEKLLFHESKANGQSQLDILTPHEGVRASIKLSSDDSWFNFNFNGVQTVWPSETLKTMVHCLFLSEGGAELTALVETAHILKMGSWLNEDQNDKLFLDIGAATGAACIPLSKICGNKVKIIAFEPAENNRRLLQETIIRNNISNIDIFDEAVSNYDGNVEFTSYGPDPLGLIPYLPETSSISYHGINKVNATISQVACISLDSFFYSILKSKKIKTVVKIDVEGFEIEVLQGGVRFIEEIKPSFSIDIHNIPGGSGTTEDECRKILGSFGYNFDKIGHVLLATPI